MTEEYKDFLGTPDPHISFQKSHPTVPGRYSNKQKTMEYEDDITEILVFDIVTKQIVLLQDTF